jgi:hypothetical protein
MSKKHNKKKLMAALGVEQGGLSIRLQIHTLKGQMH